MKDEISVPHNIYFKAQLDELEKDIKADLISEKEAQGAKAELARELIKQRAEATANKNKEKQLTKALIISTPVFLISLLLIVVISFITYSYYGSPNLPASPLALRVSPEGQRVEIENAVEKVEERLKDNPDDARGWAVIAPIYMRMQRFDESVIAYRNVIRLLPPSADTQTDLAEALLMANDSEANAEIMALLDSASKLDPRHIRSRFYLAGEAMRVGDNEGALEKWQELIMLSNGQEEWLEIVNEGLNETQARIALQQSNNEQTQPQSEPSQTEPSQTEPSQPDVNAQADFIAQMVERLETRLNEEGGTIEEWTQLVRSLLVLNDKDKAQQFYDKAKQAYPDDDETIELDNLAKQADLQ